MGMTNGAWGGGDVFRITVGKHKERDQLVDLGIGRRVI